MPNNVIKQTTAESADLFSANSSVGLVHEGDKTTISMIWGKGCFFFPVIAFAEILKTLKWL